MAGSPILPFLIPGEGGRQRTADPERGGAEGDLFTRDAGRAGVRDSFALSRAALFRVFAALARNDEREGEQFVTWAFVFGRNLVHACPRTDVPNVWQGWKADWKAKVWQCGRMAEWLDHSDSCHRRSGPEVILIPFALNLVLLLSVSAYFQSGAQPADRLSKFHG